MQKVIDNRYANDLRLVAHVYGIEYSGADSTEQRISDLIDLIFDYAENDETFDPDNPDSVSALVRHAASSLRETDPTIESIASSTSRR